MGTNVFNPSFRRSTIQSGNVYIPSAYLTSQIWRTPDYRKDVEYHCNVHVATLASIKEQEARSIVSVSKVKPSTKYPGICQTFFPVKKVLAAFDYPLKQKCILTTQPTLDFYGKPMPMYIGSFLWQVAKAYQDEIYAFPWKYQIRGHSLDDLWFEGIILKKIYPQTYCGVLEFGS